MKIPTWLAEDLLPQITSSQLAKIILDLTGEDDRDTAKVPGHAWEVIEKLLCALNKRFNDAHPGRKMEVEIAGYFGKGDRRAATLRILNDERFMDVLKREAKVVVPRV